MLRRNDSKRLETTENFVGCAAIGNDLLGCVTGSCLLLRQALIPKLMRRLDSTCVSETSMVPFSIPSLVVLDVRPLLCNQTKSFRSISVASKLGAFDNMWRCQVTARTTCRKLSGLFISMAMTAVLRRTRRRQLLSVCLV